MSGLIVKKYFSKWLQIFVVFTLSSHLAHPNELQQVRVYRGADQRVNVDVVFSDTVVRPNYFSLHTPERLIVDFSNLFPSDSFIADTHPMAALTKTNLFKTSERTRLMFTLSKNMPYELSQNEKTLTIHLGKQAQTQSIQKVDFHRSENGAGIFQLVLEDSKMSVDVKRQGQHVYLRFQNAILPEKYRRKLKVIDFATAVNDVELRQMNKDIVVKLNMLQDFEHMIYQMDKTLTVEVRALADLNKQAKGQSLKNYHGDKLSLNFQDVDVRSVLQLLADFTKINMVASDSVKGKLTLRLDNVPWDQALDIILHAKGLGMRQDHNVIWIAPSDEIATQEKMDLQALTQKTELAPLRSEFMQINYAKAKDIATMLKSDKNSLLSLRGNVSVDDRTNTLLLQDTSDKIEQIRSIITQLDTAIRQVEIEARIVIASKEFSEELGVRWGSLLNSNYKNTHITSAGNIENANTGWSGTPDAKTINDRLNVGLGATSPSSFGQIAFSLGRVGSSLPFLDLELSAAETENITHTLASPKLVTSNDKEALIKDGQQIPYQEASSSGATSTSFKDAVMELRVTPHITPDNRIIMDLAVKDDAVSSNSTSTGPPSIDTKEMTTQVLVDDGETIVLGGVYTRTKKQVSNKVPVLGDLPLISALFKNTEDGDKRTELLIFITPKIIRSSNFADNS